MPGRLAVDFGASNTVIAVWDEATEEGRTLLVPDYGSYYTQSGGIVEVWVCGSMGVWEGFPPQTPTLSHNNNHATGFGITPTPLT